jgi:hypothetical protein
MRTFSHSLSVLMYTARMNKYLRFLIAFMIVVVMFSLTRRNDSPSASGLLVGDSVSGFSPVTPVPVVVAPENTQDAAAPSMRNLVLVEFFAGF